ncbi:MAG: hypothetical protein H7836_08335 [Magnetococcus sp. YQC-3]
MATKPGKREMAHSFTIEARFVPVFPQQSRVIGTVEKSLLTQSAVNA